MKLNQLKLFDVINNERFLKKLSFTDGTLFLTPHSRMIFSSFLNKKDEIKYFHVTNNTKKRIKNVPTEKIKNEIFINLKPQKGLIYFDDGIHLLYLITKTGLYIMSSNGKGIKHSLDPTFSTGQMIEGFLYYDFLSDYKSCYINNILDLTENPDNLLKDEPTTKEILNSIMKSVKNPNNSDVYNN